MAARETYSQAHTIFSASAFLAKLEAFDYSSGLGAKIFSRATKLLRIQTSEFFLEKAW
jgi:hypothetical protein